MAVNLTPESMLSEIQDLDKAFERANRSISYEKSAKELEELVAEFPHVVKTTQEIAYLHKLFDKIQELNRVNFELSEKNIVGVKPAIELIFQRIGQLSGSLGKMIKVTESEKERLSHLPSEVREEHEAFISYYNGLLESLQMTESGLEELRAASAKLDELTEGCLENKVTCKLSLVKETLEQKYREMSHSSEEMKETPEWKRFHEIYQTFKAEFREDVDITHREAVLEMMQRQAEVSHQLAQAGVDLSERVRSS